MLNKRLMAKIFLRIFDPYESNDFPSGISYEEISNIIAVTTGKEVSEELLLKLLDVLGCATNDDPYNCSLHIRKQGFLGLPDEAQQLILQYTSTGKAAMLAYKEDAKPQEQLIARFCRNMLFTRGQFPQFAKLPRDGNKVPLKTLYEYYCLYCQKYKLAPVRKGQLRKIVEQTFNTITNHGYYNKSSGQYCVLNVCIPNTQRAIERSIDVGIGLYDIDPTATNATFWTNTGQEYPDDIEQLRDIAERRQLIGQSEGTSPTEKTGSTEA